ncbi:MAG: Uma2 family endonuclease [Leptolyngbyaceae cyanobacterium SM1_1_3]|nr:Uma2 family endonuclease [Leptolyngbyaceae cyanobacterium SM1_1_3]NJN01099.1 Uma2 family endonuclease [Leptolyngbyaceae cyanobacterium RM1_1_2]NJO10765.1 Uma2 family endonuclease [Leptolyngbyaceae cyanobacterium SL_1_1]
MTLAKAASISLEKFLQMPEAKPASEYIEGGISQKSVPKARHSRLQGKLTSVVNEVAEASQIAYAFPELRCTFGDRSIAPNISVLLWQHIELDEKGEPVDNVLIAPDWVIEILSPEQSANRVAGNILHCLKYGSQLGWLIDPSDRSVLVFQPKQQPELYYGQDCLIALESIELVLSAEQVFNWLKMS